MTTATITADKTIAATERAQRVFSAIDDGYDTQVRIMARLAMPKTTLINTLEFLIGQGRVEKHATDDRRVFYRTANAYATPVRDVTPNPDGGLSEATAYDRIIDPDPRLAALLAKRPGAIVPQRQQPAEMPAAPRSPRLAKGGQAAMVLAHLADHPADSFGPYELGRALAPVGHKPLGVRDVCSRLAANGQILKVSDSPVRYRHRPNVREA